MINNHDENNQKKNSPLSWKQIVTYGGSIYLGLSMLLFIVVFMTVISSFNQMNKQIDERWERMEKKLDKEEAVFQQEMKERENGAKERWQYMEKSFNQNLNELNEASEKIDKSR